MDLYMAMALAVIFQVLKERKQLNKLKPALFKLHAAIEAAYPELEPETNRPDEQGRK